MPGWDISPNFIRYRIHEPTYERYAQKEVQNGVWLIFGWRGGKSEIQSLRFDKRKGWTMDRAKVWVKEHRKKMEQPEEFLALQTVTEDVIKGKVKTKIITKKMPGILLVKPHGKWLFSPQKAKTLIVSAKPAPKQYMHKPIYVIENKQALGIINITSSKGPYKADMVRFRMRGRHRISDKEWNEWWPKAEEVYVYEFDVITTLDEPVPTDVPSGPQKWIKEVTVKIKTKKELITPESVKNVLDNPESLKNKDSKRLVDDHRICHMWRGADWKSKPKDLSKAEVKKLHGLIVAEMKRRDFKHTSALQAPIETLLEASPYAPIHRSGLDKGKELTVEEIKSYYERPIVWKKGFVKLVGGIPNWGKSPGCIDLRIASDDLIEDHPVVFRLGRALPSEIADRADFHDRTYEVFTSYVDLYDLVLVPSKDRQVIHMVKGRIENIRDVTARREASASLREDKVEPLRYIIPLKGYKGYYKKAELAKEVIAKWFPEEAWPIYREKKYDGARCVFMKKGDSWAIRSDDGALITDRFPNITKIGNRILPKTITFDAEVELWRDGKHQSREVTSGHLRSKGPADDSELVVNVFDVMYLDADVHKKPFKERRQYLKKIKWPQSTDKKPKVGTFNLTPSVQHKTPVDLAKGIRTVANEVASEGAVVKSNIHEYELDGITRGWVKWKKMVDIKAVVVGTIETKTKGTFNLQLGLGIPSGWKVPEKKIVKVGNKQYMYIGKSFNVKGTFRAGDIVTISFHTLFHHIMRETGEQYVTTYEPQFSESQPDERTPDSAKEAINIARRTEMVVRKFHSQVDLEELAWLESKPAKLGKYALVALATIPMDDKPHKASLHNHYRGKSVHMDFRIKVDNYAVGPTIAHQFAGQIKESVDTLQRARSIERNWTKYFKMTDEPQTYIKRPSRKLWVTWKKPEPLAWMKIEGVVEEGPGRTKEHVGVFSIIEKPITYIGTQKPAFREFFLYGKKFTGRWVIRLLPNPWKAEMPRLEFVWLMWKPEDQTPYVITKRAKDKGWIPPPGISAMPPEWRNKIPKEYQFWTIKERSKRIEARDALVQAIKKKQVKLEGYTYVEMAEPPSITRPITATGVLQHHWFEKETKPVRVGPTTEYWHFRIEWSKDKPLLDFVCRKNPLSGATSCVLNLDSDHAWLKRGEKIEYLKPGTPGNPTKATPAYIQILEHLKIRIYESSDAFMKMDIRNKKFKGHWVIVRTDPRINLYTLRREEAAPKAKKP